MTIEYGTPSNYVTRGLFFVSVLAVGQGTTKHKRNCYGESSSMYQCFNACVRVTCSPCRLTVCERVSLTVKIACTETNRNKPIDALLLLNNYKGLKPTHLYIRTYKLQNRTNESKRNH